MSSPGMPSIWTITDLVNNIMKSVRQVTQMFLDSKEQAVDEDIGKEQTDLETALQEEGTAVTTYFNYYILALGIEFSSGDGKSTSLIPFTKPDIGVRQMMRFENFAWCMQRCPKMTWKSKSSEINNVVSPNLRG
jgi:hypothetical protein